MTGVVGKGGMAKYPDVQLHPIFLKVREHHDQIVLAITKENVCELVNGSWLYM